MEYGTGAIFGCPAHDQRDLDFARKYELPVTRVVSEGDQTDAEFEGTEAYTGPGRIVNSEWLDGMTIDEAKAAVIAKATHDGWGQGETQYRLRDWGVSRQRYWGTPIPFIHCGDCGVVPVPDKDLPVTLPDDVDFNTPGNPLDRHPSWKHVACPACGASLAFDPLRRETVEKFDLAKPRFEHRLAEYLVKSEPEVAAREFHVVELGPTEIGLRYENGVLAEVLESEPTALHDPSPLGETYDPWTYCVQYRETDFNFASRMMEEEGIFYFFQHRHQAEKGRHLWSGWRCRHARRSPSP